MNDNSQRTYQKRIKPAVRKKTDIRVYLARFIMFTVIFFVLFAAVTTVFFVTLRFGIKRSDPNDKPYSANSEAVINSTANNLPENDYISDAVSSDVLQFKADLSQYEEYMSPIDKDSFLLLINVDNPLDENYAPTDLTDVADTRKDGRATQKLRLFAEKALEAFLIEGRENGVTDVTVTSAYRDYAYQNELFSAKIAQYSNLSKDEAYAKAASIVAIPGTSEHQSGLSLDMHNLPSADVSFNETSEAKWLAENCWKFGFILRFPKDKVDITGISFEPWHFRYVGRYHAKKIYDRGMCLEEYMEEVNKL